MVVVTEQLVRHAGSSIPVTAVILADRSLVPAAESGFDTGCVQMPLLRSDRRRYQDRLDAMLLAAPQQPFQCGPASSAGLIVPHRLPDAYQTLLFLRLNLGRGLRSGDAEDLIP